MKGYLSVFVFLVIAFDCFYCYNSNKQIFINQTNDKKTNRIKLRKSLYDDLKNIVKNSSINEVFINISKNIKSQNNFSNKFESEQVNYSKNLTMTNKTNNISKRFQLNDYYNRINLRPTKNNILNISNNENMMRFKQKNRRKKNYKKKYIQPENIATREFELDKITQNKCDQKEKNKNDSILKNKSNNMKHIINFSDLNKKARDLKEAKEKYLSSLKEFFKAEADCKNKSDEKFVKLVPVAQLDLRGLELKNLNDYKLINSLRRNPFDKTDATLNIIKERKIYDKIFNKTYSEDPKNCLSEKLMIEKQKLKEKKYIDEIVNYNVESLNSINKNIQNIFSENNYAINRMKKFRILDTDKELSRIVVSSDLNNLGKKRIIYKIRVGSLRDLFNGIFKGFKMIASNSKKIIKNGKIYLVKENYNGYFICPNLRKGIHYDAMLNFKLNLKNFEYTNYRNSCHMLIKLLREIVSSLGKECNGISDLLEIIDSNLIKMRKLNDPDNQKLNVLESYKYKAIEELDKSSYENAGVFLGKILGYSKLFQV